jgi:hypothetical protein
MASTKRSNPRNQDPEGRFTAAMIEIVSLSQRERPKGIKQKCARQEQEEVAYSEALQALFCCLPEGTGLERAVLVKILSLGQDCVRGGMIFQKMGAPPIVN